jgi:hypothetical protein
MEVAAAACRGDERRVEEIIGGDWKCCCVSYDIVLKEVGRGTILDVQLQLNIYKSTSS